MSAGMGLFVYGIAAFFVVILLFIVCTAADAMGRYSINMFKTFAFRDGVGNVSLLTEIVVFLVVLIVVGVMIHRSFVSVQNTPGGLGEMTSCTPLDVRDAAPRPSSQISSAVGQPWYTDGHI